MKRFSSEEKSRGEKNRNKRAKRKRSASSKGNEKENERMKSALKGSVANRQKGIKTESEILGHKYFPCSQSKRCSDTKKTKTQK